MFESGSRYLSEAGSLDTTKGKEKGRVPEETNPTDTLFVSFWSQELK